MEDRVGKLRAYVAHSCDRPDFPYREWFVTHHLAEVERIALELARDIPAVDPELISILAWCHDLSKPSARDKEEEKRTLIPLVGETLASLGFPADVVQRAQRVLEEVERKDDHPIAKASWEAQIISSADGASHFFGPFFYSFFRDDPTEMLSETMRRVREKAARDWEKKIVLERAREMVRGRYEALVQDMTEPADVTRVS